MKSFKIVFASLAVAIFGLVLSSFTVKDYYANAFARVCYAYTPPASGTPAALHKGNIKGLSTSIIKSELLDCANWTQISPTPTGTPSACDNGNFLCAICFDNAAYDNICDVDLLAVIEDWYDDHSDPTFPNNADIDPSGNVVTTYLRSTNTNP